MEAVMDDGIVKIEPEKEEEINSSLVLKPQGSAILAKLIRWSPLMLTLSNVVALLILPQLRVVQTENAYFILKNI
ncbi:uncharacterized protein LOC116161998 isoform X3 [Photinus pyralis]|uniref:uncharacterized protein LOC116161998 isoform X3 n=1 Tax=Photinus pyralis TaxID=7054 RepID=UPI0012673B04|nr:uncharacterized protein LOC116161998 isoform X3 [Photinus pyralis]